VTIPTHHSILLDRGFSPVRFFADHEARGDSPAFSAGAGAMRDHSPRTRLHTGERTRRLSCREPPARVDATGAFAGGAVTAASGSVSLARASEGVQPAVDSGSEAPAIAGAQVGASSGPRRRRLQVTMLERRPGGRASSVAGRTRAAPRAADGAARWSRRSATARAAPGPGAALSRSAGPSSSRTRGCDRRRRCRWRREGPAAASRVPASSTAA